ncbi:LysR family transcriptional regulator [Klebsiella pneumoniae]|uniref:LysR family transcriptional regulator n=1 Tax=Klebsiella pneumoniae TaxID=573 RepID=UPI003EE02EA3
MLRQIGRRFQCFVAGEQERGTDRQQILGVQFFHTQAAVSHQIKSLEDFLGLKLFRRRNRSLLLTEEGQSYFQDIKEIFSQLTEATRKLQARSAKGALTVSLLPSFAIQWLVPRLTSFNSAYPGIDVRIQAISAAPSD